jgi:hypothetical protein
MTMLSRLIDRLEREASRFQPLFAAEASIRALVVQRASIDLAQTVDTALDGALATIERPAAANRGGEVPRFRGDGVRTSRTLGTSQPRHPGTPAPRNPGTPAPQNPGTPAPRNPGTQAPRHPGTPASRRLPLPSAIAGEEAPATNLGDLVMRTPGGRTAALTPMPVAIAAQRDEAASAVTQPLGRLDAPPPAPTAGERPSAPQSAGHTLDHAVAARALHDVREQKGAGSESAGIAAAVSTEAGRHLHLPAASGAARLPGSLAPTSPGESSGELARLAAWWQQREGAAPARVSIEPTASPVQPVPVTRASVEHAGADPLTSDLENLDLFTQALERVLAREARRHGVPLGDQP